MALGVGSQRRKDIKDIEERERKGVARV